MKDNNKVTAIAARVLRGLLLLVLPFSIAASASYRDHPEARSFVARMERDHDFDRAELEALLAQAERKQSILDAISRPAEKVLEWKDYRKIFIRESRVRQGVEFWKQYREPLARAEREFGVPASVIVGIIGVETRYGGNKGSFRVVDALATLGFDYPPRKDFFAGQFEQFLLMVREQNFDPLALKGSYAGAMGYGQFIPGSYRAYAIDFDGDGIVDIIDNPVDAIGSVANYLRRHDWRPGEPVVTPAALTDKSGRELLNRSLKPELTLAEFARAGIVPYRGLAQDQKATAMSLQGEHGEQLWLGLHNFYVITRYNHSALYAMAVYQLGELVEQRMVQ